MVTLFDCCGSCSGISSIQRPFGCLRCDQQSYDHVRRLSGKLWVANRGCLGADQRERTRRKPDLVEALAGRSTAITEG